MSLDRIGWHLSDPFTVVDDLGVSRKILEHSPALWADLVRQAVTRGHERRVAAVWARRDPQFKGRRLCIDHLHPQLATSHRPGKRCRLDSLGAGIARAVVCDAVWTGARARDVDSAASAVCRLCGEADDTLHHRLWWCPAAEAERIAIAPERLIRAARAAGRHNKFYVTGVMPHPADVTPGPVDEPVMEVERLDLGGVQPEGDVHAVKGDFFFDGSCTTHVVPELRRAAFAVIVKDEAGRVLARVSSPLWRQLPQTPQAAEFAAYAAAVQFLGGPSRFFGDCLNVIRQAGAAPRRRVAPHFRYSGILRDTLKDPNRLGMVMAFEKVKAHVALDTIDDEEERARAAGNAEADLLAKAAVKRHPQLPPADEAMLEASFKDAAIIIKLAAAVLRKWPALDVKFSKVAGGTVGGRGGQQQQQQQQQRRHHDWRFVEGRWRCSACLRCINGDGGPEGVKSPCTGEVTDEKAKEAEDLGHCVARACGDGMPVLMCLRCGAWLSRRAFGLRRRCRGTPTTAGKQALARAARGRHPWRPHGASEAQRGTLMVKGKALKTRSGRERRPAAAGRDNRGGLEEETIYDDNAADRGHQDCTEQIAEVADTVNGARDGGGHRLEWDTEDDRTEQEAKRRRTELGMELDVPVEVLLGDGVA